MDRRAFLSTAAACSLVSASGQFARAQPTTGFAAAASYSREREGASLLVVRHGIVLAEEYADGSASTRWPVGEGTHVFTALLAASLVKDRLLSLDEPVALTLGDWGAHPVKASISIRQLLSGVSGLSFGRSGPRDLVTAMALEPRDIPGVRFANDAAIYVLFAEIARRKLQQRVASEADPARYLTSRTLLPIGCVPIGWARSQDGAPQLNDGAAVSARGWAQAGELIRRLGVWRAQQLVSEAALREALRGSVAEPRAGFGLWLAAPGRGRDALDLDSDLWRGSSPAPPDLVMAAGDGGQRLFISPADGLVIVRQARTSSSRTSWSDAQFLSLIWRDL